MKQSGFRFLAVFGLLLLVSGCSGFRHGIYDMAMSWERSKADLVEKSVTVDGRKMVYLENGPAEGRPSVVLVHGFAAAKENWMRFAGHLGKSRHVVAMDLPGHGESVKDMALAYGIEDQVDYLHAFFEKIGLESFHMVGNSMGGAISALYAAKHPHRVRGLCLMDPAGIYTYESRLIELMKKGKNPLIVKTEEDFYELMDFAMEQKPFMPWPVADVMAQQYVANRAINEKIFAEMRALDRSAFKQSVRRIQAPTLILWGKQDRIVDVKNAREFNRLIKHSKKVVFDDIGHAPMIEAPERSATVFLNFIEPSGDLLDETG